LSDVIRADSRDTRMSPEDHLCRDGLAPFSPGVLSPPSLDHELEPTPTPDGRGNRGLLSATRDAAPSPSFEAFARQTNRYCLPNPLDHSGPFAPCIA
jgi:hypothetical protein